MHYPVFLYSWILDALSCIAGSCIPGCTILYPWILYSWMHYPVFLGALSCIPYPVLPDVPPSSFYHRYLVEVESPTVPALDEELSALPHVYTAQAPTAVPKGQGHY